MRICTLKIGVQRREGLHRRAHPHLNGVHSKEYRHIFLHRDQGISAQIALALSVVSGDFLPAWGEETLDLPLGQLADLTTQVGIRQACVVFFRFGLKAL